MNTLHTYDRWHCNTSGKCYDVPVQFLENATTKKRSEMLAKGPFAMRLSALPRICSSEWKINASLMACLPPGMVRGPALSLLS